MPKFADGLRDAFRPTCAGISAWIPTSCKRGRRGRGYIEQGYQKHLKGQSALLSPGRILAMDRPAEAIAKSYRDEALPALDVLYFTRKRDAHSARADWLRRFASGNS